MRTIFGACRWGPERDRGSFCHLKDLRGRRHANKEVKVIYVCDELLTHAFEAHLLAAVTSHLQMSSPSDPIQGSDGKSVGWLRETATAIMGKTVLPNDPSSDLLKLTTFIKCIGGFCTWVSYTISYEILSRGKMGPKSSLSGSTG